MAVDPTPPLRQPPPLVEAEDGTSLHEYIGTILASRNLILGIAAAVLFAGVLYAKLATPIYRSDMLVQVEEKKQGIAGLEGVLSGFPTDSAADAEIEILRSRSVLGEVVRKLGLDVFAAPQYFPLVGAAMARGHRSPSVVAGAFPGFSRFAWGGERIMVDQLDVPADLEDRKLPFVAGEGGRYTLLGPDEEVLVQGEVGKPAGNEATRTSAFVSELRARPGTQFVVVKRAEQEVVEKLQKDLAIAEKGKKTGIIRVELSGPEPARLVKTLEALAAAYVRQNVDRKSEEAEKTLEFITAQLPEVKSRLEKAEEALNAYRAKHGTIDLPLENKATIEHSVEIEKAASQLQMQKAELSQKFTENHPFVAAVKKKLAEVDAERASLNARIKNLPESELNSVRLLRDVKVTNELYVLLLNKAQELQVVKSGTIGNVRILDRALTPTRPVLPQAVRTVTISLFLGILLGLMAALLRRSLNRGVADPELLETMTGLSVYASVPHSDSQGRFDRDESKGHSTKPTRLLASHDPSDLAIESLRSLRTSLQFALMNTTTRVLVLSGPSPAIGKTFVSSNLAQVLADSGRRMLIIDGDMRNGTLHHIFHVNRQPGLSDVIAGTIALSQAVHHVSANLDLLTSGAIPPNPSELLMSPRFSDLVASVEADYDLTLIDTPPILAVTDGAIIGRLAGITLVVLRSGQHTMREITLSLKRFVQGGVRPTGLVFNDVPRFSAKDGYGYNYQYDYRSNSPSRKKSERGRRRLASR